MPDSKKLTFAAPDGFDLEGKETGDTLEAVVELRIEDGGKLCVTKLNGIELAGYDEKPERKEKGWTDAVMSGTEEGVA